MSRRRSERALSNNARRRQGGVEFENENIPELFRTSQPKSGWRGGRHDKREDANACIAREGLGSDLLSASARANESRNGPLNVLVLFVAFVLAHSDPAFELAHMCNSTAYADANSGINAT
ncbi:hypothetical protein B0H13DRAFT_1872108 [Mycena leptocephala]|nr:hypothetical protein B0H13DRAFT_1872108 [Mycena leptocephala]